MNEDLQALLIKPLLGKDDRETMNKVSGVLSFVARAMEAPADASRRPTPNLDKFSAAEIQGLIGICRLLSEVLTYEPPPTVPLG